MALLKIESIEGVRLRNHYTRVVFETLQILWENKRFIGSLALGALLLASVVLALIGPRYTGEAIILMNFVREESNSGAKVAPTAMVDASALVDRAARVIGSRATASAVVSRLGLDTDAAFARLPLQWRVLSIVRTAFFLRTGTPSAFDLAVTTLMRRIRVTYEPRSYLISVAVTTGNPEQAALLANAVALEYLRGQVLQQLADSEAALERELAQLSLSYGERYPNYIVGRAKLENLRLMQRAFREQQFTDAEAKLAVGQTFIAAEETMVPSGPNVPPVLGLAIGAALAAGIWITLFLNSERLRNLDSDATDLDKSNRNGGQARWLVSNRRTKGPPIRPTIIRHE